MDFYLDKEAFNHAIKALEEKREELDTLRLQIKKSFEQLRKDWDSDAGKEFFIRFEKDLIDNLKKYALVFGYMSRNLSVASQKYEEVFRAADAVASVQY
jgi:uncharacterized protein YukE